MFDTPCLESTDHLFDNPVIALMNLRKPDLSKRLTKVIDAVEALNPFTRRHQRIKIMTEHYRRENSLLRKPCPICNTLVKPELQQQHNEAFHSL